MIVVDTNVLVYFYVSSPQTQSTDLVRIKDPDWHAPTLWRSEFRNAMAGHMRAGAITLDEVIGTVQRAEQLMANKEHSVDSEAVMHLVASSTCSAYDCEFVALAQELSVPLVTSDSRILDQFPETAVTPEQFVA